MKITSASAATRRARTSRASIVSRQQEGEPGGDDAEAREQVAAGHLDTFRR